MYSATFDVSRISDIAVTAYLRTSPPGGGGGSGGEGKDMGNDLCLGGIRFVPDLESGVSARSSNWTTADESA